MLGGQWITHGSHHLPVAPLGSNYLMEHSSSSRQMRNEAEKKRRDTLNGYINDLARLVPMVDGTPRRVDKISILRLAATYLMQNQILFTGTNRQTQFSPACFEGFNLSSSMIEDMDAFMLVVTTSGKIVFVSHTVERLLGHTQIEMFGQSLFNFTLREDHPALTYNLKAELNPDDPQSPAAPSPGGGDDTNSSSSSSEASSTSSVASPQPEVELSPPELQRRSFFIQMSQRSASRTELPEYKRVHILGNLRIPRCLVVNGKGRSKRQKAEWPVGEGVGPGMETVLIAVVKLEHRIRELSLLESSKDEYVTRHLIDGRIIYSDHRISLVAGYLSEDVNGMSAFKFMHPEDVMFTIVALRQMYDRGEGFGCSCYRLQCATGQFIYLRTHGYLEKNETTNQVTSFICINTLVCEEDGNRLIQEMKKRYSASIEAAQRQSAIEEAEASVNSNQLDVAISQLIPMSVDPPTLHSPFPDTQYMKAALTSKGLPPANINFGTISSPTAERVSVITSSVITSSVITSAVGRRRRHDSAAEVTSKRRRTDEQLTVQVSPSALAPEYSPSLSPGSSAGYSPVKLLATPPSRSRRSTADSQRFPRDERGASPHELLSPGGYEEPPYPYDASAYPSYVADAALSPPQQEYLSPTKLVDTSYWSNPVESPGGKEEPYRLEEMLTRAPDPEPVISHLQSKLQVQNLMITSIQQDIEQVQQPQTLPLPLYNSLSEIKEEHKQHQIMLKGLKKDLHKTLSERNTNI